jgi:hypothetical protein
MRTTVELPPDLMRAAKARSAERGESLKTLLTRAVAAELELHATKRGRNARVTLPLFGDPAGPRVRPSNADLERAVADADGSAALPASESQESDSKPRRRRGRSR